MSSELSICLVCLSLSICSIGSVHIVRLQSKLNVPENGPEGPQRKRFQAERKQWRNVRFFRILCALWNPFRFTTRLLSLPTAICTVQLGITHLFNQEPVESIWLSFDSFDIVEWTDCYSSLRFISCADRKRLFCYGFQWKTKESAPAHRRSSKLQTEYDERTRHSSKRLAFKLKPPNEYKKKIDWPHWVFRALPVFMQCLLAIWELLRMHRKIVSKTLIIHMI